ncbi:hypothetical protein BJX62DRAFT_218844 [Aspergillus germanicus]
MDPREYSWPSQRLDAATPTGFDGQGERPWPMVYTQETPALGVTHNYVSNMDGLSSVRWPHAIGSWNDSDPSPVPGNWLPGIMQLEMPDSVIQQAVNVQPPEEHQHTLLSAKRRMQNRKAQRRFRQKREEREKLLQDRISDLEAKCKALGTSLKEKSGETELPLREKSELEMQVQILRKQEQTLLRLLREHKGALLASFVSQASNVSSSSSSLPGSSQVEVEQATMDASQSQAGSLLLLTNKTTTM